MAEETGEMKYSNAILSSNPCPLCIEASEQKPMTEQEWRDSPWGLPGSSGRYCGDECHCLMVEEGVEIPEPLIGKEKLRGEEGTDIRSIVDIGPTEKSLKNLKESWMAKYGRLPKEIYQMPINEIGDYLRALMAQMEG